jgi:hypothetical protein
MEFLQYLQRKQLAWERRTDYFLDGQALAVAHRCWIRDCGRGRSMFVVGVVYVGYAGNEDFFREEKIELLEEDKWEGEI